ncbi:MAG TPA: methyltransferase domain-containing protein [Candidatus Tectomicrobia bacterium]|jgi:ubiquinone/menaquinone biosynthesis C-methylase UbiE
MSPLPLQTWWRPAQSHTKELLDDLDVSDRELWGNLGDLQRVNWYLGSQWLVLGTVHRLWRHAGRPKCWRILDIGTGAGDMPAALLRWSQRQEVHLTAVAIDNQWRILRYARTVLQPSIAVLLADGLHLPFRARMFDVVVCSSMLHHLEWQDGIALLQAMAAVARYGVVVNDLVRSWLSYYGAKLLLPVLSRNHLTRHDGPLSTLRAYSVDEVRKMAQAAGLVGARVRPVLTYRLLLVYTLPSDRRQAYDA